MEEEEES